MRAARFLSHILLYSFNKKGSLLIVAAAASALHQRSILLVDDDQDLCSLMVDFLGRNGFPVKAAYDGRSGLRSALAGEIDLVILDVMMPVMDGFSVLRQLRKSSAVPVIMLTARAEQADRIAGLDAGADDYLPKPFGPEELLSANPCRIAANVCTWSTNHAFSRSVQSALTCKDAEFGATSSLWN